MVDPEQASAPEMVRSANTTVMETLAGSKKLSVEQVANGADGTPPPGGAAAPLRQLDLAQCRRGYGPEFRRRADQCADDHR